MDCGVKLGLGRGQRDRVLSPGIRLEEVLPVQKATSGRALSRVLAAGPIAIRVTSDVVGLVLPWIPSDHSGTSK